MSNVEKQKQKREPLTEGRAQMEVEEIIKIGFEQIKEDLDEYFIRINSETTGHYYPLIVAVNKKTTELMERMLELIKF